MRILLATLFGVTLLSGCELLLLPLVPVILPIMYAEEQGDIVQPVEVTTASGRQLTPSYGDAAKAKFTVTNAATTCTGHHDLSENPNGPVLLQCDKGLKGQMIYSMFMTRELRLSFGPKSATENEH